MRRVYSTSKPTTTSNNRFIDRDLIELINAILRIVRFSDLSVVNKQPRQLSVFPYPFRLFQQTKIQHMPPTITMHRMHFANDRFADYLNHWRM